MKIKLIISLILLSVSLFASEVIMVQRDFKMTNTGPEIPADIYINKAYNVGKLIALTRAVYVRKQDTTQKVIKISIPYGLIKIIYSEGTISIGRLVYMKDKENLPIIHHYAPMVGDVIMSPSSSFLKDYKRSGNISFRNRLPAKQSPSPKQKKISEATEIIL